MDVRSSSSSVEKPGWHTCLPGFFWSLSRIQKYPVTGFVKTPAQLFPVVENWNDFLKIIFLSLIFKNTINLEAFGYLSIWFKLKSNKATSIIHTRGWGSQELRPWDATKRVPRRSGREKPRCCRTAFSIFLEETSRIIFLFRMINHCNMSCFVTIGMFLFMKTISL